MILMREFWRRDTDLIGPGVRLKGRLESNKMAPELMSLMHPVLILRLLVLLTLANGVPVVTKRIFRHHFDRPLDGGIILPDGQPLLGTSKKPKLCHPSMVCFSESWTNTILRLTADFMATP